MAVASTTLRIPRPERAEPPAVPSIPLPWWKRGFDLAVAGSALVVAAPVIAVIAVVSAAVLGRPVLFRQPRIGRGGTTFELIKFRTMTDDVGPDGTPLPDAERRHPWGNLLRRTSLDELPTLVNIVRGEMSVVGPRPLLTRYLHRYSPRQALRHSVTPGLTGLAQTRGRNRLSWPERFELDLEYVRTRSLRTDLAILRDTVRIVLSGDGADGIDHTSEFMGTAEVDEPPADRVTVPPAPAVQGAAGA